MNFIVLFQLTSTFIYMVLLYFLVLFISLIVLFQLTSTFIYSTLKKKIQFQ